MGPLPRDIEEYPAAFAVVDRFATDFDSVKIERHASPASWLVSCLDAGRVRAMFVVAADGAVRAAC